MRTLILVLAVVPAITFTVVYGYELARHVRATREGLHMLAFTGAVAVILLDALVRQVWTGGPPGTAIHLACVALAVCLWDRLWLLLRRQVVPRIRRQRAAARFRQSPPR